MSDPFLGDSTGLRYIFLNVVLADTVHSTKFCWWQKHCYPSSRNHAAASGLSVEITRTNKIPLPKQRLSRERSLTEHLTGDSEWRTGLEPLGPCPTQGSSPTLHCMLRVSARKENRTCEQLHLTLRKLCAEGLGISQSRFHPCAAPDPTGFVALSRYCHLLLTRVFVFLSVK